MTGFRWTGENKLPYLLLSANCCSRSRLWRRRWLKALLFTEADSEFQYWAAVLDCTCFWKAHFQFFCNLYFIYHYLYLCIHFFYWVHCVLLFLLFMQLGVTWKNASEFHITVSLALSLLVSFQTHISNLTIRLDFVIGGNKTLKKLIKNENLNVPITLTTASRNKLI